MALFEVNEKALFVLTAEQSKDTPFAHGEVVTISGVLGYFSHPIAESTGQSLVPGSYYELNGTNWKAHEMCLKKIPPKHQPDDLKAAEPHFINHQLPRWLGQEEKKHAKA